MIEIVAAAILLVLCVVLEHTVLKRGEGFSWQGLCLFLVPYLTIGWRVLWKAGRNIARGQIFDENFLMALATVGALAIGEYPEAVFVMLFYRVGELFEELAVGKSRASISSLMAIRPDVAELERDGEVIKVAPEEVAVGDVIRVRPGEKVPLDGVIIEGTTSLDTVALTGESMPRDVTVGDSILGGCVNLTGLLRVRVTKPFGESTVAKILALVENAGERKSKSEHFVTRFARVYTPAVVIAAALLALLPPLFLGAGSVAVWKSWIYRAISFLVISCPCALVISVPLSFFGGIGGASRRGILIKGSNYLETLAGCDTVVFDKTGTLTEGRFSVEQTIPAEGVDAAILLRYAAGAEAFSTHPIARALIEAATPAPTELHPTTVAEQAGHGVQAEVGGSDDLPRRLVLVGNDRLLAAHGIDCPAIPAAVGTAVRVALDGAYAGYILLTDRPKPDAREAVAGLRACGVRRTVMLTGDSEAVAQDVATRLGLDEYHAGLLPDDKVAILERLLPAEGAAAGAVAFVGDGINDAPVLARADIGIAMGGMGSDAAIEAADIVLMDDKPSAIPTAIRISRRTIRIVRQNIVFALAVKLIVLVLSALDLLGGYGMWLASFADVGVSVLAILNAMRAMRV